MENAVTDRDGMCVVCKDPPGSREMDCTGHSTEEYYDAGRYMRRDRAQEIRAEAIRDERASQAGSIGDELAFKAKADGRTYTTPEDVQEAINEGVTRLHLWGEMLSILGGGNRKLGAEDKTLCAFVAHEYKPDEVVE